MIHLGNGKRYKGKIMTNQKTQKEKLVNGFLEEIKKISLGPLVNTDTEINNLVIMSNPNFIRINPNITLDDLNTFIKNNGGSSKYDSFVDFFIEFYSIKSSEIVNKYLPEMKGKTVSLPIISFSEAEGNTVLINS
jgi:hypothetical protein